MTEDIWGQKPEFSGYSVIQVEKYLNEMDDWLEKLKHQYNFYKEGCKVVEGYENPYIMSGERHKELMEKVEGWDEAQQISQMLMRKLEAVKKQLVEFPCIHIQDYQRMMRKIEKILEAEG